MMVFVHANALTVKGKQPRKMDLVSVSLNIIEMEKSST
jgi:hypothetical protein